MLTVEKSAADADEAKPRCVPWSTPRSIDDPCRVRRIAIAISIELLLEHLEQDRHARPLPCAPDASPPAAGTWHETRPPALSSRPTRSDPVAQDQPSSW